MKTVQFRPAAAKDLNKLEDADFELVVAAIDRLAREGIGDVVRLKGREQQYRLRAGHWRVRFTFERPNLILVSRILHRREAYRD
jgi:mRNA-degrading endonuclease RelE of RelBE toxin-antitoxin system